MWCGVSKKNISMLRAPSKCMLYATALTRILLFYFFRVYTPAWPRGQKSIKSQIHSPPCLSSSRRRGSIPQNNLSYLPIIINFQNNKFNILAVGFIGQAIICELVAYWTFWLFEAPLRAPHVLINGSLPSQGWHQRSRDDNNKAEITTTRQRS